MFEASHTESTGSSPADVWALWQNPKRWPDWNQELEAVTLDGAFAVGEKVQVKLKRGGRMEYEITALEPERLVVTEARLPGARLGHEHRLRPTDRGCEITHRLYVRGFASGLWSLMLGRKHLRTSVEAFSARERDLLKGPSGKRKR